MATGTAAQPLKAHNISAMAVGGPGQERDAVWFVAVIYPEIGASLSTLIRIWGRRTSKKQVRFDSMNYWKAVSKLQKLREEKSSEGYVYIDAADPVYGLRSAVREAHATLDAFMLDEIAVYNAKHDISAPKFVSKKVEPVVKNTIVCYDCKNPIGGPGRIFGTDKHYRCTACHAIAFPTGALPAIGVFGDWDMEID